MEREQQESACGPPTAMKNAFCPATTLHGSATAPFVIPTEPMWRDLGFSQTWRNDPIGRQPAPLAVRIYLAVAKEFALNRCFASLARQMMTPDGKTVAESCLDDALPVQT
jgi:hypothetical protein